MLSSLINWTWVVECAPYDRHTLMSRLFDDYRIVASWESGDNDPWIEDAYVLESPFGIIVSGGRHDSGQPDPDPWDDAYRNMLRMEIDSSHFFHSYRDAVAELEELAAAAGTARHLLPDLRRFAVNPPSLQ